MDDDLIYRIVSNVVTFLSAWFATTGFVNRDEYFL